MRKLKRIVRLICKYMAAQDSKVTSVVVNVDANSASAIVNFDDGTNQTIAPVAQTPQAVTLSSGQTVTVTAA